MWRRAGKFEYDTNDYHRKITCGNAKCTGKEFGFHEFHVSERVETELRIELRETQVGNSERIRDTWIRSGWKLTENQRNLD